MKEFFIWLWETIIGAFGSPAQAKPSTKAPSSESPRLALPKPGLQRPGAFYDEIRRQKLFGEVFSTQEFDGCEEILKDCIKAKWPISYTAYALATAFHETARTMQPVKEYGGYDYYMRNYDITGRDPARARRYGNTTKGDGAKYCGRGYVQLTWKLNYKKMGEILKVNLVEVPDLAMNSDIASDIMTIGMERGIFTGRKMSDFLPKQGRALRSQFVKARAIINGTDKAEAIADYAIAFQKALELGQWK